LAFSPKGSIPKLADTGIGWIRVVPCRNVPGRFGFGKMPYLYIPGSPIRCAHLAGSGGAGRKKW